MDDPAVRLVGDEDGQSVHVAQPADVEVLLHGVAGGEQSHAVEAGFPDGTGGRVGDVDEFQPHGRLDRRGELVHRVGAENDQLGAGGLEGRGLSREDRAGLVPLATALELLDAGEVERPQEAVGRMQTAEPVTDLLIDDAVVLDRGLPAHPAKQADALHGESITRTPGPRLGR